MAATGITPEHLEITSTRLLLVEGKDEKNFFMALLKHLAIGDCQVEDVGGCKNFHRNMPVVVRAPGFKGVRIMGIVRDAETSADGAFESVCNSLRDLRLEPPGKKNSYSTDSPKIGVFITPGDCAAGMLEDLCLRTVQAHPAMPCVDGFMNCLQRLPEDQRPKNPAKAKAQTFLAAMPEIANSVGVAAQQHCWDFDSDELNDLKSFLAEFK